MTSSYCELDINMIELDINNPRIKMYLEQYKTVTAEGIALALNSSSSDGVTSFNSLKESIKVNQGIINPILVNHTEDGKYVVIEGNTRLQIYKDFLFSDPQGPWKTIRCIVYENLKKDEIHAIRLQCHLVGPRDWDPYSKAKYLDQLSNKEKLPMASIISFCGGKAQEIYKLIQAYTDMQQYYLPEIQAEDFDIDYRDFSKFSELQNRGIVIALTKNGYTKADFAKWVVHGNIDTAQNVRLLPAILNDKAATKEFLKSNISEAYKYVHINNVENVNLAGLDYTSLCSALINKLRKIEYKEVKTIKSDVGQKKRELLEDLLTELNFILNDDCE